MSSVMASVFLSTDQSRNRLLNRVDAARYTEGRGAGTGGNREKNFYRDSGIFMEVKTGAPIYGAVEGDRDVWRWSVARSIYLLITDLGTSAQKGTHRAFIEIFLKFDEPRAAEPPMVASNEATGAVSPGISF
jgi:hypothetical protein